MIIIFFIGFFIGFMVGFIVHRCEYGEIDDNQIFYKEGK